MDMTNREISQVITRGRLRSDQEQVGWLRERQELGLVHGIIRWYPLDRLERLEDALERELHSSRKARRRDALAVTLGLHGLRVGEIYRTHRRQFFAAARTLDVATIKNGLPRKLTLHPSFADAISEHMATRAQQSGLLLCSNRGNQLSHKQPQKLANELFERTLGAGHGLTFHSLRHTFAMRLFAETKDLLLVKAKLGHKSVRSTEVYAHSLAEIPDRVLVVFGDARQKAREALAGALARKQSPPFRVLGAPEDETINRAS